jgi:vitamin B12 transporter
MKCVRPSILMGWSLVLCAAAPAALAQVPSANSAPDDSNPGGPVTILEPIVVSPDRTPEDQTQAPASVTALFPSSLAGDQVYDLRTALSQVAGVTVVNTGPFGGISSVYIRGAAAYEALFVVDGVPMNDRAADYSNFLGGADLAGIDRIEILRGPQGSLYGSAIAGVVSIDTAHGSGTPSGSVSTEAGSFSTAAAAADVQGAEGPVDFSASLSRDTTANERPDNKFQGWSASSRVEGSPAPWALVGATVRAQRTDYEEPGALPENNPYPDPGTVLSETTLATVYGQVEGGGLTSRLTGAVQRREYDWTDDTGTYPTDNDRRILEWQNNLWLFDKSAEIIAGGEAEASQYIISGGETSDSLEAGYLTALLRPVKSLELTAGFRRDDYRSAGGADTGRAGASWQLAPGTILRANWGTGFTAPSSLDRYGFAAYGQPPNPDIQPEHSRGGDVGIEQEFDADRLVFTLAAFDIRYTDLFSYDSNTFETVNVDRATTRGVEFSAVARPGPSVTFRVEYTYLDAWNRDTGTRLVLRPRDSASAGIGWQPSGAWTLGAGVYATSGRLDNDQVTGGETTLPGYETARVFASWRATARLTLKIRVENALNHGYEETFGYPALPRGIFGGAEWSF